MSRIDFLTPPGISQLATLSVRKGNMIAAPMEARRGLELWRIHFEEVPAAAAYTQYGRGM